MEDKHATGISFSMLKDHMTLQNAEVPYSYAMVLWHNNVHRCWLPQERQDMLLRSLHLLAAPHAPGNLTCVSHTGFPARLQNIEQKTLAQSVSSGHPAGCDWARAHTASTGLSRGIDPPGSTRAASLMLPHVNLYGKVTPVHASPSNKEVGDANMLHTPPVQVK